MYSGSAALTCFDPGASDNRLPDIALTRRPSDWKRLSAGDGTKGPRLHDWCYLELADLNAEEFSSANQGPWTRGLLIRRHIADGDLAFFTTWCPGATSIETLVAVAGHRWAIEDSFETAKNEFGLDHNESRSWHGYTAAPPNEMQRALLVAQAIDRWYAPLFPVIDASRGSRSRHDPANRTRRTK